jgi:hypothetical protein
MRRSLPSTWKIQIQLHMSMALWVLLKAKDIPSHKLDEKVGYSTTCGWSYICLNHPHHPIFRCTFFANEESKVSPTSRR